MKKHLILLVCTLLSVSCAKDFLDKKPLSQLTSDNYYTTEDDAKKAILAAYSTLQVPFFYGKSVPYITEIASDDANHKNLPYPIDIFQWNPQVTNDSDPNKVFSDLWKQCYEGVYRSNLVIERVQNINFRKETDRKAVLAEAHFLRALYYWHLTAYWGGVPLVLKVATSTDELYVKKSTYEEVYKQIIDDLIIAEVDLPESWDSDNLGRATKWAAKALLGKAYIYNKEWANAVTKLQEVVTYGPSDLLPKFRDIFSRDNEFNKESIFEIQYGEIGPWPYWNPFISDIGVGGEGDFRDQIMAPQGVGGQKGFGEIIAERDLVEEFELFDLRLRETVHYTKRYDDVKFTSDLDKYAADTTYGYNASNGELTEIYRPDWELVCKAGGNKAGDYYHIKKAVQTYQGIGTIGNSTNNWRMIRHADVLLLLAEALNESGRTAEAAAYLNKVRARARPNGIKRRVFDGDTVDVLPDFQVGAGYLAFTPSGKTLDFTAGDLTAMRGAIVHERRVELAFEYHRFLDLTRWERIQSDHPGAANVVFSNKPVPTGGYSRVYNPQKHSRCPIPQYQIDLSKGTLDQNPLY